jgi:hypothetical protein
LSLSNEFVKELRKFSLKFQNVANPRTDGTGFAASKSGSSQMGYLGFHSKGKRNGNGTVFAVYDLCLVCAKHCKRSGPLWFRLECPCCSVARPKYSLFRRVNMTDGEIVARVAYG